MIRKLYKKILWYLPNKLTHQILYYRLNKTLINYSEPNNLDEKIHILMATKYGKDYAVYADKYLVRNYVKSKGYESLLPKLYGVYDSIKDIKIEELPQNFILKANHGSGEDYYIICKDKYKSGWKKKLPLLQKALNSDYGENSFEYHYSGIERKIICEELLEDPDNERLIDYKVHCLNGEPHNILVCSNRGSVLKLDFYDLEWRYLDYAKDEYRSQKKIEKPSNLDLMLNVSKDLSEDFPLSRIDFYEIQGKLYFGEITLTPAAGNLTYLNREGQIEMGKDLII